MTSMFGYSREYRSTGERESSGSLAADTHTHVLDRCSSCETRHCACISCEAAADYMAADADLLGYAQ